MTDNTGIAIVSDGPMLDNGEAPPDGSNGATAPLKSSNPDTESLPGTENRITMIDLAGDLKRIAGIRSAHPGILVLVAEGLAREERVQALQAGVDLIIPNRPDREELALILRNLARLAGETQHARQDDPAGDWVLDQTNWRLTTPLGHQVHLQRAEAAVLGMLMARPGVQQFREDLAASFKSDREDKNRSLDVVVSKIRKKVRQASDLSLPLRSVRGVGYVFAGNARLC